MSLPPDAIKPVTVITRYNAFVPDKPGHYSCPSCYLLTKASGVKEITCVHCGRKAPILAGPATVSIPIVNGVATVYTFRVFSIDANYQYYKCMSCSYTSCGGKGLYAWQCPSCLSQGPVSYREICNACLMGSNIIKPAEYVCSKPSVNHTAGHNKGLTEAGKCANHCCSYACKKI